RVEGTPFVEWAPLLPAWLALGEKLGISAGGLARATGGLSAAGVSWAPGLWTARSTSSRAFGLGAALVTALSFPLIYVAAHLWSDAPFLFLSMLGVLALGEGRAFRAAWFAALACLMRYLGVTLVAAGALFLFFERGRRRDAVIFSAIASAPLALWLARNALVTGT